VAGAVELRRRAVVVGIIDALVSGRAGLAGCGAVTAGRWGADPRAVRAAGRWIAVIEEVIDALVARRARNAGESAALGPTATSLVDKTIAVVVDAVAADLRFRRPGRIAVTLAAVLGAGLTGLAHGARRAWIANAVATVPGFAGTLTPALDRDPSTVSLALIRVCPPIRTADRLVLRVAETAVRDADAGAVQVPSLRIALIRRIIHALVARGAWPAADARAHHRIAVLVDETIAVVVDAVAADLRFRRPGRIAVTLAAVLGAGQAVLAAHVAHRAGFAHAVAAESVHRDTDAGAVRPGWRAVVRWIVHALVSGRARNPVYPAAGGALAAVLGAGLAGLAPHAGRSRIAEAIATL